MPGFVVLLAPSQPSSSGSSWSRRVDLLVHRVVMGVSMVISLCCVLCRLLPRELLQGFWCRHDRHDVPLVCDSSLLPWGLLRVILMSCIACLCGSACLHVTSLSDLAVSPILFPWSFQRILNVHGSLSGLKAKHLYMWFFLTAAVLVTCFP